ncbi:MAG: efflux RND transporter permease subunit [Peptococcaceae bacterium]|jgi:HAE1 family hydrophobic/amphiphilic exporter-1|nr:efflux RND transporter permease subunit [Peptococcaceae bacterium]
MKIANVSVDRPVLISMIMVALILLGAIALPLLPVDLYPNIQIPVAIVSVSWSGATPPVVEQQVTKPVEAVMGTVSNVNQLTSISSYGQSTVILKFAYGTNLNNAIADMRDKINQVTSVLPSSAGAPQIMRFDINSQPIMTFALSAKNGNVEQLKQLADDVVQPRLEQVPGVSQVSVGGGKTRQIQVVADPARLASYGLSINSLIQALQNDNLQGDAGLVDKGSQEIDVHVNGLFATPGDVLNVPVPLPSGGIIKIADVARVEDTYADVTEVGYMNGVPAVSLNLYKMSGGNTVQVSDNVQKVLPAINHVLPPGVKLTLFTDQARYIRDSINHLVDDTLWGALFGVIILWLFLRRVRTTLVVAIGIPIAVVSTFALLYFTGQTINTITLMGLSVGLGSLLDFAIVVIESIFRHRESGLGAVDAAKTGTAEVGTAVLASALAQVSVFAPVAFVQGLAAELFLPMALAVAFSHLAALAGALTLVPMLAAKLMRGSSYNVTLEEEAGALTRKRHSRNPAVRSLGWLEWIPVGFSRGVAYLTKYYRVLLTWALNHRRTVVLTTVVLIVASLFALPVIGFELIPNTDQGAYTVGITLDQDTKLAITRAVADQVVRDIQAMPETESVATIVGSSGGFIRSQNATNQASIQVDLKPLRQRRRSVFQVMEQLRGEVKNIPGAQITVQAQQQGMGYNGPPIQVVIEGNNLSVLNQLGDLVAAQIARVPGTRDVQNTMDRSVPEYDVNIDRVQASQYGLTVREILDTMEADYGGTKATSYVAGSTSVDVVVKLPESYTRNYNNLSDVTITSPSGVQVPLSAVATVTPGESPAVIREQNQMPEATVQADIFGRTQGQVQQDIQARLARIKFPAGYTWQFGGNSNDMSSSFTALGLAMPLGVILMYMVMAALFESLFSPFIVLFALPGTFVGVMAGLLVMHESFSINSLIGMIMLIGLVANNAIVLVDYANQQRRKGLSTREALLTAGPVRLRPILMTTGVIVLTMLPLLLFGGSGSESWKPVAAVVAFGLTVSTLVTLVLVPVMYEMIDDWGRRWRKRWGQRTDPGVPASG